LPKLDGFTDKPPFKLTGNVSVTANAVRIKITATLRPDSSFEGASVTYHGALIDANSSKVLANLHVTLY
jgi:hypothetical protein